MSAGTEGGRAPQLTANRASHPFIGAAVLLLRAYRVALSPWLGPSCRFEPTCSCYAEAAIRRHGLIRGCLLATRRIVRCNPLGASGYDPVP